MRPPRRPTSGDRRASGRRGSSLDEPVDDGARQQRPDGNGWVEVCAAGALEPEAVHLAEPRHGLAGPAVDVPLAVGDPEQVPDDLFEVIWIGAGQMSTPPGSS